MRRTRTLALTLAFSLPVACGGPHTAPAPAEPGQAPTVEELRGATFDGLEGAGRPVTLVDGRWEDESGRLSVTLPRDFRVTGDLDGAPPDEAVVLLSESTGGSGTFNYLAVVGRRDGRVVNIATTPLGDRVALRDLRIESGMLVADVLQAGPGDAMCCPGELATRSWKLDGSALTELPAGGEAARLSLAAIGTGVWVLQSWALDETAPVAPEVTLQLSEGRLVGSSGCNTYTTTATAGDMPGAITIGPVAGTRMMCPDAEMAVEDRFLVQLGQVTRLGFMLGQLALTYQTESGGDVMLFDRR